MPNIEIRTMDGLVPCYEAEAAPAGTKRSVLLYMDGLGLRDALRGMADRLAAAGYRVLVPDLYYRVGPGIHFDPKVIFADPAKLAEMRQLLASVKVDYFMRDTRTFIDYLGGGPIGAVGYCMGGRAAFVAASRFPEVRAAASIHPGGMVSDAPDSPHLGAAKIQARLYIAQAKDDVNFTDEQAEKLRAQLDA